MEILESVEGTTLVITFRAKRLDAVSAPALKRHLSRLADSNYRRFLLDISEVEFIDSYGLSTLAFALKRFGDRRELGISGPRDSVLSILKLTRFYRLFNIFADTAQALSAIEPERPEIQVG